MTSVSSTTSNNNISSSSSTLTPTPTPTITSVTTTTTTTTTTSQSDTPPMHENCHRLLTAPPLCPDTLHYPILKSTNISSTSGKIEELLNKLSRVGLETDLADCFLNLRNLICLIEYPQCNPITGNQDKICETIRDDVLAKCVKKGGSEVDEKAWKEVIRDEMFSRNNCFMGPDKKASNDDENSAKSPKTAVLSLEVHSVTSTAIVAKPTGSPSNSTAEIAHRCTPGSYQVNLLKGTCNFPDDPPTVYFTTPEDPNCKDHSDLTKVQIPYICPCHSKTFNIRTPCPKPRILTFHEPELVGKSQGLCNPISNNLIASFNTDTCSENVEFYSNDLNTSGNMDRGLFNNGPTVATTNNNRKRNQNAGDNKAANPTELEEETTEFKLIQDDKLIQLKDFSRSTCLPYQCSGHKNFLPPTLHHFKDGKFDHDCNAKSKECDSINISKDAIIFNATDPASVPQLEFHLLSKSAQNYFLLELKTLSNPIYSGFRVYINNSPVTPLLTNVTEFKTLAIQLPYAADSPSKNVNRVKVQHTSANVNSTSVGSIKSILLKNCELNNDLDDIKPFGVMKTIPPIPETFDLSQHKLKSSLSQSQNQTSGTHSGLVWMIPTLIIIFTVSLVGFFAVRAYNRNKTHTQDPMLMGALKNKHSAGKKARGNDIETERLYDASDDEESESFRQSPNHIEDEVLTDEDDIVIMNNKK